MKKNILLTALCMFSIVVFAQTKQLTILHTNDTHSQIMPFNTTLADTLRKKKELKIQAYYYSIVETSVKVRLISPYLKAM